MTDSPAAGQRALGSWRRYPSLSLEQAVERARTLYQREKYNPSPLDVIARHWGFKNSKTGPFSTAYSAVKQFGLIDESGSAGQRKAAVSQRAKAILTAPADVRDQELRTAALEPAMNSMIWETYGAQTGSEDSFRWHLATELGFSETGAREFAKQYEATLHFAGLDREDEQEVAATEDPADDEAAVADVSQSKRATGTAERQIGGGRASRHAIPLVGGKQVILEGDFPLTESAWQGFMLVLSAFKPGLVVPDPPTQEAPQFSTPDLPGDTDEQ